MNIKLIFYFECNFPLVPSKCNYRERETQSTEQNKGLFDLTFK